MFPRVVSGYAVPVRDFHRPVQFGGNEFEDAAGGTDPAEVSFVAHETARSLLSRARTSQDPDTLENLLSYTDTYGLAELAELWSLSPADTLPGVLWRLYLMRAFIGKNPVDVSFAFQAGQDALSTVDPVVAGVESPVGPDEVRATADEVLRGAFQGDFAVALERAAAFCRVTAAGCTERANQIETLNHEDAHALTKRALRLMTMADEFVEGARLWRADALD